MLLRLARSIHLSLLRWWLPLRFSSSQRTTTTCWLQGRARVRGAQRGQGVRQRRCSGAVAGSLQVRQRPAGAPASKPPAAQAVELPGRARAPTLPSHSSRQGKQPTIAAPRGSLDWPAVPAPAVPRPDHPLCSAHDDGVIGICTRCIGRWLGRRTRAAAPWPRSRPGGPAGGPARRRRSSSRTASAASEAGAEGWQPCDERAAPARHRQRALRGGRNSGPRRRSARGRAARNTRTHLPPCLIAD